MSKKLFISGHSDDLIVIDGFEVFEIPSDSAQIMLVDDVGGCGYSFKVRYLNGEWSIEGGAKPERKGWRITKSVHENGYSDLVVIECPDTTMVSFETRRWMV